jgi:3-phosphoshikimate 1-carboxyvinyltransferase
LTAHAALQAGLRLEPVDEAAIADLARRLPVRFEGEQVLLNNVDVTDAIRSEHGGHGRVMRRFLRAIRKPR